MPGPSGPRLDLVAFVGAGGGHHRGGGRWRPPSRPGSAPSLPEVDPALATAGAVALAVTGVLAAAASPDRPTIARGPHRRTGRPRLPVVAAPRRPCPARSRHAPIGSRSDHEHRHRRTVRARALAAADALPRTFPLGTFVAANPLHGLRAPAASSRPPTVAAATMGASSFLSEQEYRRPARLGSHPRARPASRGAAAVARVRPPPDAARPRRRARRRHAAERADRARSVDSRCRPAASSSTSRHRHRWPSGSTPRSPRWCAAYLDQGQADWTLPRSRAGPVRLVAGARRRMIPACGAWSVVRRRAVGCSSCRRTGDAALAVLVDRLAIDGRRGHRVLPRVAAAAAGLGRRAGPLRRQRRPASGYLALRLALEHLVIGELPADDGAVASARDRTSRRRRTRSERRAVWQEALELGYRDHLLRPLGDSRLGACHRRRRGSRGAGRHVHRRALRGHASPPRAGRSVRDGRLRRVLRSAGPGRDAGPRAGAVVPGHRRAPGDGGRAERGGRARSRSRPQTATRPPRRRGTPAMTPSRHRRPRSRSPRPPAGCWGRSRRCGPSPPGAAAALSRAGWPTAAVPTVPTRMDVGPDGAADGTASLGLERPHEQVRVAHGALTTMGLTVGLRPAGRALRSPELDHEQPLRRCARLRRVRGQGGRAQRPCPGRGAQPTDRCDPGSADAGIRIPDTTWFVAAEHETTTDTVHRAGPSSGAGGPPRSSSTSSSSRPRRGRSATGGGAIRRPAVRSPRGPPATRSGEARRRSADWAEPRPRMGTGGQRRSRGRAALADRRARPAASCVPALLRSRRGRATGRRWATILTGPLVVGHWISSQYYFSSVDPVRHGAGTKPLHNVAGGIGVLRGPGRRPARRSAARVGASSPGSGCTSRCVCSPSCSAPGTARPT